MKRTGRTIFFILSIICGLFLLVVVVTNLLSPKEALPDWLPELTEVANENIAITQYQDYCTERMSNENSKFLLSEEKQLLESSGYVVYDDGTVCYLKTDEDKESYLYYPMLFNNNGKLDIWFVDNYAQFHLSNNISDFILIDIHLPIDEEKHIERELLFSNSLYSLYYVSDSNFIQAYSFGKMIGQFNLPQNALYVGFSQTEGYIFRADSSVHAVAFNLEHTHFTIRGIATDVEMVLTADYCYSAEKYSQPLLLMKNGEIKVFISDMDLESYDDDPSTIGLTTFSGSLEDIEEGGYFTPNSQINQ